MAQVNSLGRKKMWQLLTRLFHAPTRTTSSGFFMLISEAIRDVEQTNSEHMYKSWNTEHISDAWLYREAHSDNGSGPIRH